MRGTFSKFQVLSASECLFTIKPVSATIIEHFRKVRRAKVYLCQGEENQPNPWHPYNQGLSTAKLQRAKQGMEKEMGMGMENCTKKLTAFGSYRSCLQTSPGMTQGSHMQSCSQANIGGGRQLRLGRT